MISIKKFFTSRYKDGFLIEADYKQLEIVALAILSGDEQLKQDLRNKVDLHTRNAADLFAVPEREVTKEQRRIAKSLSFQLQYGASAGGMSKKLNLDIKLCKRFVTQYYARYPAVGAWQYKMIKLVELNRQPCADALGTSTIQSITGRLYRFKEEYSDYSKIASFRPTQIKNYPVQGFATGDIVQHMLGVMYFAIKSNPRLKELKMINTVHDSILFDCPLPLVDEAVKFIKATLEAAPERIKDTWNIDFDLPLEVDIKIGRNWGEMEKYEEPQ